MKYFVTSSLNIDNILSTESISPFSFYQKRSFGYERIEQLAQFVNFADLVILFSEIPNFTIEDSERDNHPLVIQIDDEDQFQNVSEIGGNEKIKIFAFNNTIHINPSNCKLLFFSDQARILSRHNCLDSKLNKLINYYKFETIQPSNNQLNDLLTTIDVNKLTVASVDFNDNLIDRAKGFIYGYYLGASNDLPSDVAVILAKQKRIYDIVAAKINNNSQISESLDNELSELDSFLSENDPLKIKSQKLWEDFATKHNLSVDQLNTILKELGCEVIAKNIFVQQHGIVNYKSIEKFPYKMEDYRHNLDSYVRNLVYNARNKNVSVMEEIQVSNCVEFNLKMENEEAKLFNNLLQTVKEISNIDEVRTNRFDVLQKFGKRISEHFGKESQERNYWVSLASNVRQSSPFDVKGIDNIVLQSLAAFVLKGEDYETLTDFIATNAITTYKYALAIWGAVTGYVNISRPLLEKQTSRNNFERLYADANKLIFGKDLKEKLEYQTYQNYPVVSTISAPKENETLSQRVCDIIDSHKRVKISEQEMAAIHKALSLVGNDGIAFINSIDNEMESLDKGIFPWLQKELHPNYKKTKKTNKKVQNVIEKGKEIIEGVIDFLMPDSNNRSHPLNTSVSSVPVGQYFYCDRNAWSHIEALITDINVKKKIKADLDWFQSDVSKPKDQRKYYKDLLETDNNAVISRFCHLKSGNDNNGKPKAQYFTEDLRKVIESKLKAIYNVK